ncbi:MAG: transglutaminase domain-containing protein [Firmicutes bacterium]|nr:transglutaminase domain-containing protein [Bacillota bacterium]
MKENTWKKITVWALILVMCLSVLPVGVFAEETDRAPDDMGVLKRKEVAAAEPAELPAIFFGETVQAAAYSWRNVLKNRMEAAFKNMETTMDVSDLGITTARADINEILYVISALVRTRYSYMEGGFYYVYNGSSVTDLEFEFAAGYGDSNGNPNRSKIQANLKSFDAAVSAACSYAAKGSSDVEKAMLLHDYLARQNNYPDLNNLPQHTYDAYGCLVEGSAVCNGYAYAYSYLLEKCGITSCVTSSEGMNHAWNLVYMNGGWYHVDITWDDPLFGEHSSSSYTRYNYYSQDEWDMGYINHEYFGRSDNEFYSLDHYGWAEQQTGNPQPSTPSSGLSIVTNINGWYADGSYCKVGGKWYFSSGGTLYRTNSLFSQPSNLGITGYYLQEENGLLYYTDLTRIFQWDPQTGDKTVLVEKDRISEMTIWHGKIRYAYGTSGYIAEISIAADGWTKSGDRWYYYENGQKVTGWKKISNKWYYFEDTGAMHTGWLQSGSNWYYMKSSGEMATGMVNIGGKLYYFNSNGVWQKYTGWKQLSSKWYYFDGNSVAQTGWKQLSGKWYYFNTSGVMQTGMVNAGGKLYYFNADGVWQKYTGWKQLDGKWYYFDGSSVAQTGWKQLSGKWYYFNSSGVMQTGWRQIGGKWYYFNAGGDIALGWKQIGGTWYYFKSSGAMACNETLTIGGKNYRFDSSGAWIQ